MTRSSLTLFLALALPLSAAASAPDFGLMLNDDGDLSFTGRTPAKSIANLQAMVDSLAGTPVKTFMYSVGAGSDVLYYPTKVASVYGWRRTKYDDDKRWAGRNAKIRAGIAAGVDPILVAGESAKRLGLFFVPSYRMNDSHFMSDPFEYPLTGEFWLRHHTTLTLGTSPIPGQANYSRLLDFSHEAVRSHRRDVVFEIINRYADVMDGVELDFNRVQVLFPPGKAKAGRTLVTDLITQVRGRLDAVGTRRGRRYYLFVRVPPALRNCLWAGLDVEEWMKRRLVDVVIPAQLMTLAHDMPVDEFVALAKPAGCKVFPAIYPRASWSWPFSDKHAPASYAGPVGRGASAELVRGAASDYWAMGAAGFQLYNFNLPPTDTYYRIMRDLARPEAVSRMSRVYAITPAYYLDHEDTYQYRKQVPAEAAPGSPAALTLMVGDGLAKMQPAPDYCALRVGLRDAKSEHRATIEFNGHAIHTGPMGDKLVAISGPTSRRRRAHPEPPTAYLQMPITDLGIVRQGTNELLIVATDAKLNIAEVQLGVLFTASYSQMLVR